MSNSFFQFKQFIIHQDNCAMKVCTDSCLFGALLPLQNICNEPLIDALEIGTGTGLLSLMYAQLNENTIINSIEIDSAAYTQAKENVSNSTFAKRINLLNIDFNDFITNQQFDLIFCNPPFYEYDLKGENNQKNIAHHSSNLTLQNLISKSFNLVNNNGIIALLIPEKRSIELENIVQENGLFIYKKITIQQTENHSTFRVVYFLCKQNINSITENIIIKINNEYSSEFKTLLKNFYLNL